MDESGDGLHIDNNFDIPIDLHGAGDQPHGGIINAFELFFNRRGRLANHALFLGMWDIFEGEGANDIDEYVNDEIQDNIEEQEENHHEDHEQEENHHEDHEQEENHHEDHDRLENNDGIIVNNNAFIDEDAGVNQGDVEDPLPGVSSQRSREDDGEDIEESSSKKMRWWDDSAESSTDTDTDPEEDLLPGPSNKRNQR